MSPGLEIRKIKDTGKFVGLWVWGHYGVDFVKEHGKWKFKHFHVFAFIAPPYDMSWTEPAHQSAKIFLPDEIKPDEKTAY